MYKSTSTYNRAISGLINTLAIMLIVLAIIGVSAAIIVMLFGKPIGDDYGGIATFRLNGSWIHEEYRSITTTGRYGQSIAGSILYALLGNHIPVVLPLITLVWFIGIIFIYIKKLISKYINLSYKILSFSTSLTVILTFLVLFINKSPETTNPPVWASFQDFFWPSGIITYTIPLLLLLTAFYVVFFTNLASRLSFRKCIILWGIAILFTSLFNEVQPVFLMTTSLLLFTTTYAKAYKAIKRYRPMFAVTTLTSIIGLLALYFSPGRAVRSQIINTTTRPTHGSILKSVKDNLQFLTEHLYLRPREVILLLLTGMIIAFVTYLIAKDKNKLQKALVKLLPFSILVVVFCIGAIVTSLTLVAIGYGYDAGIYSRTLALAQIMYVTSFVLLTFNLTGIALIKTNGKNKYQYIPGIIFGVVGILFVISIPRYLDKILMQVNSSVTYSNAWTAQDTLLRNTTQDGKIKTLYLDHPATGIGDSFSLTCTGPYAKSTMWLNELISQYYNTQDKVCTKE